MVEKKEKNTYYFNSYNDDVVNSKNQDYILPNNYKWIKKSILYNICSKIIYALAKIYAFVYSRVVLNVKVENKKVLKQYRNQGYFLYGNHTQELGDIFVPADISCTKRIYVIGSPANLGIPVIGKILPMLGILPTPNNLAQTKELLKAVNRRIQEKKCVVIYPEAHVWPYYTKIRPFNETAFKFPVECGCASFCITTTYYERKSRKKPGIKIYIDGPFLPDNALNKKENQSKLCKEVYDCMNYRSKNSNYEYVKYEKIN